jgi:hypothetical protein
MPVCSRDIGFPILADCKDLIWHACIFNAETVSRDDKTRFI